MPIGKVLRIARSGEAEQAWRFRWSEEVNGYYVTDSATGETRGMGDGVDMFCNADESDCLVPGTQRFYDALNAYFQNEQAEIAMAYFGMEHQEKGVGT